jgi:hypothetical protein
MDIDVKRFDDVTRALKGLPDYTVIEAVTRPEEGLVVTVQPERVKDFETSWFLMSV